MAFPPHVAPRLLEGRLALITGAGQGNGRALALGLAPVSYTHLTLPTKA